MPPRVEIGKGHPDSIHIFSRNVKACQQQGCAFPRGNAHGECHVQNGDVTVVFGKGMTRYDLDMVKRKAPCAKP